MRYLNNFFYLVLLAYSTTTFSEQYFLNVFENELPVPIDYSVNPSGYSKNTKVRLIRKSDKFTEWTEIKVSDIAACGMDCSKVFSEEDNFSLIANETIQNVHFIQYEYTSPTDKFSFYLVHDENILIRVNNDNKLVERWKELLEQ